MKYTKDNPPRRGDFLMSDGGRVSMQRRDRAEDKRLQTEYPHFAETLSSVGLPSSAAKLQQLADERRNIEARLNAVGRKIEAIRRK